MYNVQCTNFNYLTYQSQILEEGVGGGGGWGSSFSTNFPFTSSEIFWNISTSHSSQGLGINFSDLNRKSWCNCQKQVHNIQYLGANTLKLY